MKHSIRRLLSAISLLLICCTLLCACQGTAQPTEPATEASTVPEETKEIYQKSDPKDDDTINILMIGNSGCYYYVEELYGLAQAAGIKLRVCNVYYSGCKLNQHWSWWKLKEAHYEYYTTDENGRVKTEGDVDLEFCLQQQNWDFISLQDTGTRSLTTTAAMAERKVYLDDLYGYLREQFPMSKLCWQQSSAYQVGYNINHIIASLEDQEKDNKSYRDLAIAVSEKYNVDWIPRGDAAMLVRRGGYDNLCARLGKGTNHEGDYYHDGDIGGGQYLTACVWFETLLGQSCIGNTYRPDYTYKGEHFYLDEALVQTLQNAAHKAVAERNS